MSIVIKVSFVLWYMWWLKCGFGFLVNHAKVEQLSIKSKKLKNDIYRTANFLSTSEAKTRLIGWYLVPSVVKVSICFMSYSGSSYLGYGSTLTFRGVLGHTAMRYHEYTLLFGKLGIRTVVYHINWITSDGLIVCILSGVCL